MRKQGYRTGLPVGEKKSFQFYFSISMSRNRSRGECIGALVTQSMCTTPFCRSALRDNGLPLLKIMLLYEMAEWNGDNRLICDLEKDGHWSGHEHLGQIILLELPC